MGSQFKNRFRPQVESLDERCLPSTSPILTVPHAQPLTGYSAPSNRAYYAAANQGDRWTIIRQDPDYPKTYTDPTSASARADARQDSILFPRATIYVRDNWTGRLYGAPFNLPPDGSPGTAPVPTPTPTPSTFTGIVLQYRQGNVWRVYRGQVNNYSYLNHGWVTGSGVADMNTYYRWGNEIIALERQMGVRITSSNIRQYIQAYYQTFSTATFHVVNGVIYPR